MSSIKSFDLFQKISYDNITKPTFFGALISAIAIGIISLLLFREFVEFLTPTILKDSIIYNDENYSAKLHVNLDVIFFKTPCAIISVDQQDMMGAHRMDISDTIKKQRLDKKGNPIANPKKINSYNVKDVSKAIEDGEQCRITGYVSVNKVPGNIHISYHAYRDVYMQLSMFRPELFESLQMNHKMFNLNFGKNKINEKILSKFGFNEHTAFNRANDLPDYSSSKKSQIYDYFIKLVPHLFEDSFWSKRYMAYQYSLNFRNKESEGEMPIISLNYDFSPVTMKVTHKIKSAAHTLTNICAIVGGVYVIFNMINRIFSSLCDFSKTGVAQE